jgi:hypothetical protein
MPDEDSDHGAMIRRCRTNIKEVNQMSVLKLQTVKPPLAAGPAVWSISSIHNTNRPREPDFHRVSNDHREQPVSCRHEHQDAGKTTA